MTIAIVIHLMMTILIVRQVILGAIHPIKTIAWIFAIFFIPILGILLYFMIGRNSRTNKFFQLDKSEKVTRYLHEAGHFNRVSHKDAIPFPSRDHLKMVNLLTKSTQYAPCWGNDLKLLNDGKATFKAIFKAIDGASHFIHIEYYIFEDGELADRFLALLKRKAKEGVEVRFIYDDFGSRLLSRHYLNKLRQSGIKVYNFLPRRFGRWIFSLNYRNHRKIIVVDGLVAFTGGINVSDKYINGDSKLGYWHDTHLQLQGSIVNDLQTVFALDWCFASGSEELLSTKYLVKHNVAGKSIAQVISSGPDSLFASIHQMLFTMINNARKYIYISNPYIIPSEVLTEAITVAALSGIDVRLLISSTSDSKIVSLAMRSYFESFLKAGVKIYQYPDGFLHSKILVCDDELATIGTANLDIRSFEQNYEVNILVYEKAFALKCKEDFLNDCQISIQVDYEQFSQRSKAEKINEGLAKIFSPLL